MLIAKIWKKKEIFGFWWKKDVFWTNFGIFWKFLVIPDPQLHTNSPKGISFQSGVID